MEPGINANERNFCTNEPNKITMKPDYFIYFDLEEMVCKHVYDKYGAIAWSWFDPRFLETIHWIRAGIGKPMYANDWKEGGKITQRGLRCNMCDLVKKATKEERVYMTSHLRAQAGDFITQGMEAQEVREWIVKNSLLLPHPVRIEGGVSWLHLDVCNLTNKRVYVFKP